jgi:hypothetical protein
MQNILPKEKLKWLLYLKDKLKKFQISLGLYLLAKKTKKVYSQQYSLSLEI